VETIEEDCFAGTGDEGLASISFPGDSQLSRIGKGAFSGCELRSIEIPRRMEVLEEECLNKCQYLSEVTFAPGSMLTRIDDCAFYGSNLDSLELPAILRQVTGLSLLGVRSITVAAENSFLRVNNGFLTNSDDTVRIRCLEEASRIEIPTAVNRIEDGCFCFCSCISAVVFPANMRYIIQEDSALKSIGRRAFFNSGLCEIMIPAACQVLEAEAFAWCFQLSKVGFEEKSALTTIGNEAFSQTIIESIRIPSKVVTIGQKCFHKCKNLKEVVFEDPCLVQTIGAKAFCKTGISRFRIPSATVAGGDSFPAACAVERR
jgi:hypothetical protein